MKNKKQKRLLLCLCCALLSTMAFGAVGCKEGDNSDSTPQTSISAPDSSSEGVEEISYTVSYSVDGTIASTVEVESGALLAKPADPAAKEGYVFVGWYTDSAFTKAFAFGATPVKSDLTLYARYVEVTDEANEFTVTFVVDGAEAFESVKTLSGMAFNLPTPEKEGAEFAGWWVSDYDDAAKLTYKYDGQKLGQNTTLYAVWQSAAPLVSVNAEGVTWTAKGVNNSYSVKITDPEGKEETSSAAVTTYAYNFAAKEAGDYVVEITLNGETTTAYYKNKALAKVSNFMVEDSKLIFNAVDGAQKYLVTVECGTDGHAHIDQDNGASTYFDFSACDMKEGGIKFVVKAVADGYIASESAEYVFEQGLAATELTVDEASATLSWTAVENATSYKVEINGVAQTLDAAVTSLDLKAYTGELSIKVTPVAHGYNSPAAAELAYTKVSMPAPTGIQLNASTIVWDKVDGATKYLIKIGDKEYEALTNEFELTSEHYDASQDSCTVSVKAVGALSVLDSMYSDAVVVNFGTMSNNLTYANGEIAWEPVINVSGYEVQVNDGEIVKVTAQENKYAITFTQSGANTVKVRCVKADGSASDWVSASVDVYEVAFETSDGVEVDPIYKAVGDTVALPTTEAPGYDFAGWYNSPNGTNGTKYGETLTQGAEDLTLYAHWTAKEYTVTLVTSEGTLPVTEIKVRYKEAFKLPELVHGSDGSQIFFGGWYTEENGRGFQYTDRYGNSLDVWSDAKDLTLYADWIYLLKYYEVYDEDMGGKGYQVVAGDDIKTVTSIRIPISYNGLPVIEIGASAFEGCGNLTKIELPDTIQDIAFGSEGGTSGTGSAFRYCYNLRNIEVYQVAGSHTRFYESVDGVLLRNNSMTGQKELAFFPSYAEGTFRVPDGVTALPVNVFNNSKLTEIIIPTSVRYIDPYAFKNMYANFTTLTFEEADTPLAEDGSNALVIGAYAFQSCSQLKSITLPARTAKFADDVEISGLFYLCSSFVSINVTEPSVTGGSYYTSKDGLLCNADGTEVVYCPVKRTGEITIPSGVNSVGKSAFNNCSFISKVTIPAWVTEIGTSAFEGCTGVKELVFEGAANDSPIMIGNRAFYACRGLTSLDLPLNLGGLGDYAFGGTINLTTVTMTTIASADNVGEAVFGTQGQGSSATNTYYITSLTLGKDVPVIDITGTFGGQKLYAIDVDPENPYYATQDGILFDKNFAEILYFPTERQGTYTVPSTVTRIGAGVFKGKYLFSVTIPSSVVEIADEAFAGCDYLTEIIFENADAALTETNGLTIGDSAFNSCDVLKDITLPVRLTSIGDSAFYICKNITGEFVVPENVTSIGASAFNNCTGITSIVLPASLKTMGSEVLTIGQSKLCTTMRVFYGCTALTAINVAEKNETYASIDGVLYGKDEAGIISDLIYCPVKKEGKVTAPSTVTKVWSGAFYNTLKVNEVYFETAETPHDLSFGSEAFYLINGASLEKVTLPEGITTLTSYMFDYCTDLKEIIIPNTVVKVTANVFNACNSLTTVYFEEGNDEAELSLDAGKMFYRCTSLTTVNLPKRTTYIGTSTFYGCTSLESIVIPANVTVIYNTVFQQCPKLSSVTFEEGSQLTTIGSGAFRESAITSIDIPEGVTSIGGSAFINCDQLTSITLPKGVSEIGSTMFQGCTKLTEVNIPEDSKLTTIGQRAFSGCKSLTAITLPASLQTMAHNVFEFCYKLESVTFAVDSEGKSNLKSIGNYDFMETALKSLTLPESYNKITLGTGLFMYCKDITDLHISSTVETLGATFDYCASFKNITIADGNKNLIIEDSVVYNKDKTAIQMVLRDLAVETFTISEGVTEIGSYAFAGQSSLKKIVIPASVKKIGTYAFLNCRNLETVEFATSTEYVQSLAKIDNYTFQNCVALKSINLPATVTSIGNYAFDSCKSLESITLPSDLETLGTHAFRYAGLTGITIPENVKVLSQYLFAYCDKLSKVELPAGLTTINGYVFYECYALTKLEIPQTVTTFAAYALSRMALEEIVMPGVATIEISMFKESTALKKVTISEGTTTIKNYAFDGCTGLEEVKLPSTLKTLQSYIFRNCTSLEELTIPEGVTYLANTLGWASSTSSRNSYLCQGCTSLKTVNLPSTLVKIGSYAFEDCTSLVNIDLSKVTDIDNYVFRNSGLVNIDLTSLVNVTSSAFANCADLESVKFGNSLTKPGLNMFQNCVKLASIEIPSSVTALNSSMFDGCVSLTKMVIPENITAIPTFLFNGCTNLEQVIIKGNVTSISNNAFAGCEKLTSIDLPDSVTTFGNYVFQGTPIETITVPKNTAKLGTATFGNMQNLKEILVKPGNLFFTSVDGVLYDTEDKLLAFPAGKTLEDGTFSLPEDASVGSYAFYGCHNVKKLILPESLTEIAANSFYGAFGLEEVVLGSKTETIGNYAFSECNALKKIAKVSGDLEGITTIGSNVFRNTALTEIKLPETLESIGTSALEGTKLVTVTIPSNITVIPTYLFRYCADLKTVILHDGVTEIQQSAFQDSGLTEIKLPASLETINASAFAGSALKSITIPASVTLSTNGMMFQNCTALETVVIEEGVTDLTKYLFAGCTSLKNVTLPKSLLTLGTFTFQGCTSLESIVIPENVTTIGSIPSATSWSSISGSSSFTFDGCTALKNVTILGNITHVGTSAFAGCTALESIALPETVEVICSNAFNGCTALTSIVIPENVRFIGNSTFSGCTALASIVIPEKTLLNEDSVFAGWTAEQTIYVCASEYEVTTIWRDTVTTWIKDDTWDRDCNAKVVYNYTEKQA